MPGRRECRLVNLSGMGSVIEVCGGAERCDNGSVKLVGWIRRSWRWPEPMLMLTRAGRITFAIVAVLIAGGVVGGIVLAASSPTDQHADQETAVFFVFGLAVLAAVVGLDSGFRVVRDMLRPGRPTRSPPRRPRFDAKTGRPILGYDTQTGEPILGERPPAQ